jgi:hypothetical protein
MNSSPRPLHPVRVSVVLTAVAVALGWAGNVTAGCGEHVVVLKPAAAATDSNTPADDTPPPTAPCHGPHCHANPANPLPAPVTGGAVPTSSAKEQFTPLGSAEGDDCQSLDRPFVFTSPSPIDRASSIFHPPRA